MRFAILPRRLLSASITQQHTMKRLPFVFLRNLRELLNLLTDSNRDSRQKEVSVVVVISASRVGYGVR